MSERPATDHSALVFLLGVLLFVSPLSGWWSALALPWYAMFVPWALVIALAALNAGAGGGRGGA